MTTTWIDKEIARDPEFGVALAEETLVTDATEALLGAMKLAATSRSMLAEKLEVSRAFVTQLLNGGQNLTLRTLARVAYAIGFKVAVSLRPLSAERVQYRGTLCVFEPPSAEGVVDGFALGRPERFGQSCAGPYEAVAS